MTSIPKQCLLAQSVCKYQPHGALGRPVSQNSVPERTGKVGSPTPCSCQDLTRDHIKCEALAWALRTESCCVCAARWPPLSRTFLVAFPLPCFKYCFARIAVAWRVSSQYRNYPWGISVLLWLQVAVTEVKTQPK